MSPPATTLDSDIVHHRRLSARQTGKRADRRIATSDAPPCRYLNKLSKTLRRDQLRLVKDLIDILNSRAVILIFLALANHLRHRSGKGRHPKRKGRHNR